MIVVKNISKKYVDRVAISNVSFSIKKGDVVGFLGPNGAGKTTTMRVLTGYMAPDKGEVLINGLDIFEEPIEVKKKMGYLPEFPPVYTDMLVKDYLEYVFELKQCPKEKKKEFLDSAMAKTGVTEVQNRLIGNLSKGFKQRLGLAQALVSNPEILILDEPTVGLDPKQVIEMREVLRKLKGQHTIILSTHILSEVQHTCNRVVIINEGKIISEDSLENLSKKMSAKRRLSLNLNQVPDNFLKEVAKIEGVLNVKKEGSLFYLDLSSDKSINERVAKWIVSNNIGLCEMKEENFNLEDIFIQLTRRGDESKRS